MIAQTNTNLAAVGVDDTIGAPLADAGYCSQDNLSQVDPDGPELFVAVAKDWKQRQALRDSPAPTEPLPDGLSATQRMELLLLTERGRALYAKRSYTVEPVFGQIKDPRTIVGFMRRGLQACQAELQARDRPQASPGRPSHNPQGPQEPRAPAHAAGTRRALLAAHTAKHPFTVCATA